MNLISETRSTQLWYFVSTQLFSLSDLKILREFGMVTQQSINFDSTITRKVAKTDYV